LFICIKTIKLIVVERRMVKSTHTKICILTLSSRFTSGACSTESSRDKAVLTVAGRNRNVRKLISRASRETSLEIAREWYSFSYPDSHARSALLHEK